MRQTRIVIEGITPQLDCGRYAVKAVVADHLQIAADIWKDGHDLLKAAVLHRRLDKDEVLAFQTPRVPDLSRAGWREVPMTTSFETNDRWFAAIPLDHVGAEVFTVVAWTDAFGSYREELGKKHGAGQDVASELLEGVHLVERTVAAAHGAEADNVRHVLDDLKAAPSQGRQVELMLSPQLFECMTAIDPRQDLEVYPAELPLWVDRERARFSSWYEIFPRSQGSVPNKSATLREAERRLPAIAELGFDVLYLAPIHPIGETARKGPDNNPQAKSGDPGSPWAVGSRHGGHTAIHPELGTLADFDSFTEAARRVGMEIALDFAVQCSPDHPWVKDHPEWFAKRPDGSIKYAENPPKKYQDIYPIDFETTDRAGLYKALLEVVQFWISHGVRIFRVDNPHTKPVSFWEWLIASIHAEHPDVLFLAEAFTRPKRMKLLAKVGFTQSYSYFTWRNTKAELEEYATELFLTDVQRYMRPNFFANTPDILHAYLQAGGRPAFMVRLVLAATLSPSYGIYSGFELCENRAVRPGSEEYAASEKYEIKVWDWDRAGNIKDLVALVNRLRREHRALQLADDLAFLPTTNAQLIAYAKVSPDGRDRVVCVVNLDPFRAQEGSVHVPPEIYGGGDFYQVRDLLSGASYGWRSGANYVRLDPQVMPAHVLHVVR